MQINNNLITQTYQQELNNSQIRDLQESRNNNQNSSDEQLKSLASEFASILFNEMFKSMRNTLSDDHFLHGGFSEEVFTGMLDQEISQISSEQNGFNSIGRLLYQQLNQKL
ncbi:MAG: rod-binding protein [Halanaerobiales bacterium]